MCVSKHTYVPSLPLMNDRFTAWYQRTRFFSGLRLIVSLLIGLVPVILMLYLFPGIVHAESKDAPAHGLTLLTFGSN